MPRLIPSLLLLLAVALFATTSALPTLASAKSDSPSAGVAKKKGKKHATRRDTDGDGIPNARDVDGDGIPNAKDKDMDGDGIPNFRDKDMDGDGIPNFRDKDMDGDGVPNNKDADADGDGYRGVQYGVPNATSVRVPSDFFGVVNEDAFVASGAKRATILAQTAATGVTTIRRTFDWSQIEREPGVYDFAAYDGWVADSSRAGFTQLATLFNPPAFRSSRPAGNTENGTFPPSSNGDFARFAQAAVARYGPNGSFWAQNPSVPQRPIRSWQVWGEPNVSSYWPTGPNPAQYTTMLKTVSAAIRDVDPGAEIVSGSLPNTANGMNPDTYLEGMYDAGAGGSFNTLAVNPYSDTAGGVVELVRNARRVMNAHGDLASKIWVTELGWASSGPDSVYTFGDPGQALLIRQTLEGLVGQAGALNLRGIVYFNWQDARPYAPLYRDFWGLHTGLLTIDGRAKPAYTAFREAVLRLTGR